MSEITLTQPAIDRVHEQRREKGRENLMLRVTVQAGGCSGFEYVFDLDENINDDDQIFDGCVVIDGVSLSLLAGSEIDFVEELIGSDFKINNPNAVSGCGCGTSFAITGV